MLQRAQSDCNWWQPVINSPLLHTCICSEKLLEEPRALLECNFIHLVSFQIYNKSLCFPNTEFTPVFTGQSGRSLLRQKTLFSIHLIFTDTGSPGFHEAAALAITSVELFFKNRKPNLLLMDVQGIIQLFRSGGIWGVNLSFFFLEQDGKL